MGYRDSAIGSPTTMVFATELSAQGIIDGIKNGRTVVKLQDPTDPMIEFDADGREGDTVRAKQTVAHAKVTGALSQTFHWVKNGVALEDVTIDKDPFTIDLPITPTTQGEDRIRAEVDVDGSPRTITSHIYFQTGTAVFGPMTAKASGCSTSSGDANTFAGISLIAVIAALVRRRVTRGESTTCKQPSLEACSSVRRS
jgi:hypothetical protein